MRSSRFRFSNIFQIQPLDRVLSSTPDDNVQLIQRLLILTKISKPKDERLWSLTKCRALRTSHHLTTKTFLYTQFPERYQHLLRNTCLEISRAVRWGLSFERVRKKPAKPYPCARHITPKQGLDHCKLRCDQVASLRSKQLSRWDTWFPLYSSVLPPWSQNCLCLISSPISISFYRC